MINWEAFGSLELVQGAIVFILIFSFYRVGKRDGVEDYLNERAELRAQRRKETTGKHRSPDPFPGDEEDFEKLATHDELSSYAETGDIDRLNGETAAFFRLLSLREWTRKRETAS